MITAAFACGEMTEPAVLRERHLEGVFRGGFWVNGTRAVEAVAVASAFHSGGEAVMLKYLLKRHSGFDRREVDEGFCHKIMNCALVFVGRLQDANTSAAHGIRRQGLAGVDRCIFLWSCHHAHFEHEESCRK